MSLPEPLLSMYNAQSQEVKDKLRAQLGDPENQDPVQLCCKTTAGVEVCIAIEHASECAAGNQLKSCTHGMTYPDGSVTCYDEQP